MKNLWFHLMPYQELPDDFKQKHSSVWVDIDSSLYDPAAGHRLYHEYIDELVYAAQAGFDGICVNEHHANAFEDCKPYCASLDATNFYMGPVCTRLRTLPSSIFLSLG